MQLTIGIDEVGRGPLAGPITVCALAIDSSRLSKIKKIAKEHNLILRDSKQVPEEDRNLWKKIIQKQRIVYTISSVSPKVIDKINILESASLAATRATKKLLSQLITSKIPTVRLQNSKIKLDGSLYLKDQIRNNKPQILSLPIHSHAKSIKIRIQTIIKGDEKIGAVSLASIIAKVHRDKMMQKLHKKYPNYHLDVNKGYGTKKHLHAIKKHGSSPIHRLTFLKNYISI